MLYVIAVMLCSNIGSILFFYDEMIWKRSFLFLLSILIRHLIKIKIYISELGRSRASAHELQLIDGGDFQKKDVSEIERNASQ
ncbi:MULTISPECIES: hypothetical protein [Klebsiella]|uniref:hypothetical protein n=1 Tax=Klebsiella TaxID=570 RepID=UPI001CBB9136|nr:MULTISPECIES: hypothetical protein [Klebsiella]MBZ5780784.1 hypothetical protein [Klebsiella aerogenes]